MKIYKPKVCNKKGDFLKTNLQNRLLMVGLMIVSAEFSKKILGGQNRQSKQLYWHLFRKEYMERQKKLRKGWKVKKTYCFLYVIRR